MLCSSKINIEVFGGDKKNYNARGINIEKGIAGAQHPDSVKNILSVARKIPNVKKWLAPTPGNSKLANKSLFQRIPSFGKIERGATGDIVELADGEGYMLFFADCMIGGLLFPDGRKYAFHAGWAQLLEVIDFFKTEISNLGEEYGEIPCIKASYGYCLMPSEMTLQINENTKPEEAEKINKIIKEADRYASWSKVDDKDSVDMTTLFRKSLASICKLGSNTLPYSDGESLFSHRGKDGANLRNLGLVYFD